MFPEVDRERKKAEEALRKSEEYFEAIIQHSSDIILVVDKLGTITYVSPSVERFLGYGPDELIGKSTLDLIMPDDKPRAVADFGRALLTKEVPIPNVFRIRPKNGPERILEGIGKNLLDNPIVAGFVMNIRDITDRKRMEEQLQLHAEIERNMSEAVCLIRTNDALIVYTNPSFDLMFGYDPGELIGRHVGLVNAPGDKDSEAAANEIISSLAKTGMWSNEVLNRRKDGTAFWCQTNVITFEHPRYGQVWLSMHKDITERKQAEEKLRESEKRYRALYDFLPIPVYEMDFRANITSANQAIYETFGGTEEDLKKGFRAWRLLSPEGIEKSSQNIQRLLKGEKIEGTEYTLMKLDGSVFPAIVISSVVYSDGKPVGLRGAIVDVTERKRTEEELRASQQIIEGIINAIPVRVFWKDKNLVYLGCNTAFARDAGFADPKDIIGKDDYQMVWRDQAELYRGDDRQVIESGCSKFLIEEPQTTPEGNTITLLTSKIPLRNSKGEISGVLGTYLDITERKRAEEALRESEERFRLLIEQAPDAIAVFDVDEERFVLANAKAEELFGCRREGLLKYGPHHFYTPIQPDGRPIDESIKENIERVLAGEEVVIERAIHNAEGRKLICELRIVRLPSANRRLIRNSYIDITERKQAEEALRESEASYRALFENANEAIFVAQGGKLVFFNPRTVMMSGYSAEELWSRPYIEFIHPDDRDVVIDRQVRRRKGEELSPIYEVRIIHKDGNVRWVELNVVTINWKGRPATLNFQSDITERKQAGELIQKNEALLKEAQQVAHIGHWELDNVAGIPTWSEEIFHIFGLDPAQGEPSFEAHRKMIHPDDWDILNNAVTKASIEGIPFDIEFRLLRPDASIRWMNAKGNITRDGEGQIARIFGIAQDVTERKQVEEKIKTSLQEKETMLKEIHHRVKNNLQVIQSLLNLQVRKIKDPLALEVFNQSRDRIRSMSLVHEKLYQSPDLSRIDMTDYLRTLSISYFIPPSSARIG